MSAERMELRAARMNGCAFRIEMQWRKAQAAGEREDRLYVLTASRELSVLVEPGISTRAFF